MINEFFLLEVIEHQLAEQEKNVTQPFRMAILAKS